MDFILQNILVIIGIVFEVSALYFAFNYQFGKRIYDESGFWFGVNDSKVINDI